MEELAIVETSSLVAVVGFLNPALGRDWQVSVAAVNL